MNDFKNKVALITGGSRGMGAETAKLLAEKGARVFCAQRTKSLYEDILIDLTEFRICINDYSDGFPEKSFEELLLEDKLISKYLSRKDLDKLFNLDKIMININKIYKNNPRSYSFK